MPLPIQSSAETLGQSTCERPPPVLLHLPADPCPPYADSLVAAGAGHGRGKVAKGKDPDASDGGK